MFSCWSTRKSVQSIENASRVSARDNSIQFTILRESGGVENVIETAGATVLVISSGGSRSVRRENSDRAGKTHTTWYN